MEYQKTAAKKEQSAFPRSLGLIICTLGACFYLYEFILQVAPGIITTELMRDLHIDAATLGVISSAYFYSYMPMQLPAGVLYDRFGPRILLTLMTIVCACGALFFSQTDTVLLAAVGRAMMGVGSAFAFIGALVLVSRWLPSSLFAVSTGVVQFLSSIGAIVGGMPLAYAVDSFGWRHAILGIAMIGFFLAAALWLVVRDAPPSSKIEKPMVGAGELQRLKNVCHSSQTWIIASFAFLMWAPIIVFAELWGVPFLKIFYGISTESASGAIAMVWLGIGIGSPLLGHLSQQLGLRRTPLIYTSVVGLVISILMIYCQLSFGMLYLVLFIFGTTAGGSILTFALVKENNLSNHVGTAIGLNNMMVVAGGAVFQPFVGFVLRETWSGQMLDGVPLYTAQNYQLGMMIIPLCYLISGILSWRWIKENYCQQNR